MKLEPLFKSSNNTLIRLEDGREYSAENIISRPGCECQGEAAALTVNEDFFAVDIPWTLVGLDEDSYNEQFLSDLRDYLKILDDKKKYVIIRPVADKTPLSPVQKEDFVASYKHCARRIKDCSCVVGFSIPECCDSNIFREELSAKHKHYIYFSNDKNLLSDESVVIM